ncbi:MAG: hypothetical protein OSJ62_06775 [Lachnospiraceae bacterium]|nr:hypothetical protein [Lachnospiraceae bacterium]
MRVLFDKGKLDMIGAFMWMIGTEEKKQKKKYHAGGAMFEE